MASTLTSIFMIVSTTVKLLASFGTNYNANITNAYMKNA